jgi:hypothetical protein
LNNPTERERITYKDGQRVTNDETEIEKEIQRLKKERNRVTQGWTESEKSVRRVIRYGERVTRMDRERQELIEGDKTIRDRR